MNKYFSLKFPIKIINEINKKITITNRISSKSFHNNELFLNNYYNKNTIQNPWNAIFISNENKNKYNCSLNKSLVKKYFSLYIPQKKLIFQKHSKHGNVYPVYIADSEYNKKNNPKKIKPFLVFFSSINFFICVTGFQIIPMTQLYEILFLSDTTVFFSVLFNVFLVKKYLNYLIQYKNRVKNLFLLPTGNKIIIETFDKITHDVEIQDIFERRVYLRYDSNSQKNSIFTNNENSFRANISWGFNKENYFEGKRKILDYEILHQIINRTNIDTTQEKYKPSDIQFNFWTPEEKRRIVKKFSGRKILEKFNFTSLRMYYFYLKKRFLIDNKINWKRKNTKDNQKPKDQAQNCVLSFDD